MLQLLLKQYAKKHPKKVFLNFNEEKLTFDELDKLSSILCSGFYEQGLEPGDRLAFLLNNSIESVLCFFACLRSGIIAVPLNTNLSNNTLCEILADAKPSILISEKSFLLRIKKMQPSIKPIMDYFLVDIDKPTEIFLCFNSLFLSKFSKDVPTIPGDFPAVISYTSGSTRRPLGVVHTHNSLTSCCKSLIEAFDIQTKDSTLITFPLYLIRGLSIQLLTFFLAKASVVLATPTTSSKELLKLIQKYKVTKMFGLPNMYLDLIETAKALKFKNTSLNLCFSTGESFQEDHFKDFHDTFNIDISEGLGLLEAQLVTSSSYSGKKRLSSIGKPLPGVEIQLIDDEDQVIEKPNCVGEILIKSNSLMQEYWNNPHETTRSLIDGWLWTGDLAFRDKDGNYFFFCRKCDVIRKGTKLISPLEIETVVSKHPKIKEVCCCPKIVFGREDEIAVFYSLKKGESLTPQEVIQFCTHFLGLEKMPTICKHLKEMPKTPTGTLNRSFLRDSIEGLETDETGKTKSY